MAEGFLMVWTFMAGILLVVIWKIINFFQTKKQEKHAENKNAWKILERVDAARDNDDDDDDSPFERLRKAKRIRNQ